MITSSFLLESLIVLVSRNVSLLWVLDLVLDFLKKDFPFFIRSSFFYSSSMFFDIFHAICSAYDFCFFVTMADFDFYGQYMLWSLNLFSAGTEG